MHDAVELCWSWLLSYLVAPKRAVCFLRRELFKLLASSLSSWVEEQPGCWEEHLLVRWWRQRAACSTLHRCGQQAEDDGELFWSSCCRERRCPPTRGSQHSNTRALQPSRLEHQRQHAQHSCLYEEDDEYDQQGTEALLGMIGSWTWCPLPFLYRDRTCLQDLC